MRFRHVLTSAAAFLVVPFLMGCEESPTAFSTDGPEVTPGHVAVAAASKKKKERKKKKKKGVIVIDNNVRKTFKGKTTLGCPPNFHLRFVKVHSADRNGDGRVCVKFVRKGKKKRGGK